MAGRLMGQLQGAARTGGVHDLIQLSRLFRDPKWSEELEEFVTAAAQQAEATEKLGTLEEIEGLKELAAEVLVKAKEDAERLSNEAGLEADRRKVELDARGAALDSYADELDNHVVELEQTEASIEVRQENLTAAAISLAAQTKEVEAEWIEAKDAKDHYDQLVVQIKAALPGAEVD